MIPQQQLNMWSAYPSPGRSVSAHGTIKTALSSSPRLAGHEIDIYVQGSYRNHVNTRRNSDVDVVAELTSVCEYDTRLLTPWNSKRFWREITYTDYSYEQFRTAVTLALQDRFGTATRPHSKAIEVAGNTWRLKVDVLPALRYRQPYTTGGYGFEYHDGLAFWLPDGRRVINWPHHHFQRGVEKNERTSGNFKPSVRMFKNARRVATEKGLLKEGLAPSYFMQGLLANVPDECYGGDRSKTYVGVVNWLVSNQYGLHQFRCQNAIDLLFGQLSEQWDTGSAVTVIGALARLWNEWS